MNNSFPKILLTGATGYVGGRLLKYFQRQEIPIRCLARRAEFLKDKITQTTEVAEGDLMKPESLLKAFEGIETAYYLVHSMGAPLDVFKDIEQECAHNFVEAAKKAGIKKIIYLGGLTNESEGDLSAHFESRLAVGKILKSSGITVIEFRASIIIGAGSLSYEMIRSLTERLPIMITPKWVYVKAQPIFIDDVLEYLVAASKKKFTGSTIFEIGGETCLSYADIMNIYAQERGLKRYMIAVPFLTPHLSSLWLGLVTPLYARVGRKLINSITNTSIITDTSAITAFPEIKPKDIRSAIRTAIDREHKEIVETHWYEAIASSNSPKHLDNLTLNRKKIETRKITLHTTPETAFNILNQFGYDNNWFYANWAWNIRGVIDYLIGGVGLRRQKINKKTLNIGDPLGFWRVANIEKNKLILLEAEMKLPGKAWLEFQIHLIENNQIEITQTAIFEPLGLLGELYWYLLYPIHVIIFSGMIKSIAQRIENGKAQKN